MWTLIGAPINTAIAVYLVTTKISALKKANSGYLLTGQGEHFSNGARIRRDMKQQIITGSTWWKSVLPWPGKKKWAETVLAKVALLGATPEYMAVSAWDWDEAWVIVIDGDSMIASSNKIATALAYLKHIGVEDFVPEEVARRPQETD